MSVDEIKSNQTQLQGSTGTDKQRNKDNKLNTYVQTYNYYIQHKCSINVYMYRSSTYLFDLSILQFLKCCVLQFPRPKTMPLTVKNPKMFD